MSAPRRCSPPSGTAEPLAMLLTPEANLNRAGLHATTANQNYLQLTAALGRPGPQAVGAAPADGLIFRRCVARALPA